jgi:hypothetical protein
VDESRAGDFVSAENVGGMRRGWCVSGGEIAQREIRGRGPARERDFIMLR